MDESLTRLAFRVQGGDRDAARALLVEAWERQHAAAFDRAAKALGGGEEVLSLLEARVSEETRARVRAALPLPSEAAGMFAPGSAELDGVLTEGSDALIVLARWTIEGLLALPKYGSGLPYFGAAVAKPWIDATRASAARVEAPWIMVRVLAAIDPSKKALADALVVAFFRTFAERAATTAQVVLGTETLAVRRLLWTRLVTDHADRLDEASLAALLDDPPTRAAATAVLLRRGPAAAKHLLPFLHATAPGTRRAVAVLLAALGDAEAVPFLRQAMARERDARTRMQLGAALEKISGAEQLVPKPRGEEAVLARARATLAAPRQPKAPAWLAEVAPLDATDIAWRDGSRLANDEVEALLGRLALLQSSHIDPSLADVRSALGPSAARAMVDAIRAAFVRSKERRIFPDFVLRAVALLGTEADVDTACEEIDENLRTSARERWRRAPAAAVELAWDPEAIATSDTLSAFGWLVHWAETAPKRRDREKAQRALATATRNVPESERPFACIRRFGLDGDGRRRFEREGESLVVRVLPGGAIEVTTGGGAAVLRLPSNELGTVVKAHVTELETALLEARRTLAEAYADHLVVDVRFVRDFLLRHPLWRPIAHGCVVRRESAPETLRAADEAMNALPENDRVRFVLVQVES